MRELLLINGCAGLAYSALALLLWWVRDEGRDTPVTKVLTRRMKMSPRATSTRSEGACRTLGEITVGSNSSFGSAAALRVPAEKVCKMHHARLIESGDLHESSEPRTGL